MRLRYDNFWDNTNISTICVKHGQRIEEAVRWERYMMEVFRG